MVQDPINLGFDDPSSLGVPPAFRPIKALKKAGCAVIAAAGRRDACCVVQLVLLQGEDQRRSGAEQLDARAEERR